ncbi:MAG: serine hydrolase domain-containing protein [Pirellulaceae bacterium]|nr:serine hydrolase domain-containing protein [Pirellulaceae bacterium]
MPLPIVQPHEIDLDSVRLARAYDLLEEWTAGPNAPVPGGAILVGRRGKIVEPRFFGRQGPEQDAAAIRRDAIFLLASITKPVVYMAGLILVERGLLNLSDPVMRYLPEFAAHHKEATLVQHLFTHTSGLPDMLANDKELRAAQAPMERFIQHAIRDTVPLFPPGTGWSYQSMGTLVVAELIQKLSGMRVHDFVQREILDPLGLKSTRLGSKGLDEARLVRVLTPPWQGADFGWNSRYWREFGAPWGTMFSSPEDFAVICQTLLAGGRYGDVQLLSPNTVRQMTTNRLDDCPDLPEPIRRSHPWGLGWKLNAPGTRDSLCDLLGRQVFGHTGSTGTMVWMDPATEGFCILFTSAERARAPWRLVSLSNVVAGAFL